MVPFILPAVLQILDLVTQDEFIQYMLPRLIPVMSMKEPIQIILIFLQNLHILSEKFPIKEFRNYVLPMLQLALDIDNKMIQELCLKSLPTIGRAMDLTVLRNSLIPRIQRLCLSTEYLSIRIFYVKYKSHEQVLGSAELDKIHQIHIKTLCHSSNRLFFLNDIALGHIAFAVEIQSRSQTRMNCLLCIGKLLDHLDKWIVMDDILPFLQQIKSREPTVLIAILGKFTISFKANNCSF
ncbi:unnamed protein product [Schistosoma mattheei]|uniref:Uncharacterized protein n=1 Tax=Schistosoma mattheei TaxID=31246 RepID=A0A183NEX7_9TREM|nr:unnamed protein product [Schistosoma mattheei]